MKMVGLIQCGFQIGVLVHAGRFPKVPGLFPRRSGSCTVFAVLKFVGLDKTKEGFRFEPSSGLPGDLARSRTENFFVCSEDPCRMARDHWGKGRDSNPHKGTVALRKLASCGKLRTHSRTLRTRVASRRAQRAAVHCIRNPRRFLTCAIPVRFAGNKVFRCAYPFALPNPFCFDIFFRPSRLEFCNHGKARR